jgi:hypothetical protein
MRGSRLGIVVMLIISLVAAAGARDLVLARREATAHSSAGVATGTRTSLANMNSFALALLLGGLRGPLVMILWTSSEQQ